MRIDDWVEQADPRQVDALVMDKILGMTGIYWFECYKTPDCGDWTTMGETLLSVAKNQWSEGKHPCVPPRELDDDEVGNSIWYEVGEFYSTDPACLWEILDKLDEWKVECNNSVVYEVAVYDTSDTADPVYWARYGVSDNVNHAVIIAALKNAGVEEMEEQT